MTTVTESVDEAVDLDGRVPCMYRPACDTPAFWVLHLDQCGHDLTLCMWHRRRLDVLTATMVFPTVHHEPDCKVQNSGWRWRPL
jgi:hypothetical protein